MLDPNKVEKLKSKDYRDSYMESRVRTSIALQVRALREQRDLNQTQYAQLLGKPQSVLSRLENTAYGKVSVQTLLEIARALDVALIVRFCSYDEFFKTMGDVSPRSLRVESFEESLALSRHSMETSVSEALSKQISGDHQQKASLQLTDQTRAAKSQKSSLRDLFSHSSDSRQPARKSATEAAA